MGPDGKPCADQRAAVDPKISAASVRCLARPGHGPGQERLKFRFFRTICGRFALVLRIRDELSTASVGQFVASADRRPLWATLRYRLRVPTRVGTPRQVRPRRGSKPHCSCCGKAAAGYDLLPTRRFEFIPIWAMP